MGRLALPSLLAQAVSPFLASVLLDHGMATSLLNILAGMRCAEPAADARAVARQRAGTDGCHRERAHDQTSQIAFERPAAISWIQAGGGRIGLTHCPGRSRPDAAGRMTTRDLDEDLAAIEAWGATVLVSLVEAAEFERLGAGGLPVKAKQRSFAWLHAPIADMQAPAAEAVATLARHAPR